LHQKQVIHYRHSQHGTKKINYELVKSKRLKTSEIIVDDESIIIKTPYNKSLSDIEGLLRNKMNWIIQKQKENKKNIEKVEIIKPSFQINSTVPYLGRNLKLNVIQSYSKDKDTIEIKNNQLNVFIKTDNDIIYQNDIIKTKVKILYMKWMSKNAEQIFEEKVLKFSKIINVNPRRITIKTLKNRWGSLTKEGTINLNVNLMKAPNNIIDYIIIHELCHFMIKGHSHKFWRYLHKFVPNYNDKINWLEINGANILN
jgi:predicted metal-dependent hydrolase